MVGKPYSPPWKSNVESVENALFIAAGDHGIGFVARRVKMTFVESPQFAACPGNS
jgi:hypothetical protein